MEEYEQPLYGSGKKFKASNNCALERKMNDWRRKNLIHIKGLLSTLFAIKNTKWLILIELDQILRNG